MRVFFFKKDIIIWGVILLAAILVLLWADRWAKRWSKVYLYNEIV